MSYSVTLVRTNRGVDENFYAAGGKGEKKAVSPSAKPSPKGALAGVRRSRRLFSSEAKKKPATSYSRTGGSRTTLGDGALDFRVRTGNGYGSSSMVTGKKPLESGTKENRTLASESESHLEVKQ